MKIKHYLFALIAFLAIYLSGCKKDVSTPVANGNKSVTPKDSVLTPNGLMPRSKVFLIEPGYHISIEDGRVLKVNNKSGQIMAELGKLDFPVAPSNQQQGLSTESTKGNSQPKPPTVTNTAWQAYSYWHNTSTQPITSFSTTWIVPPAPSTNTGNNQLIYIFNGTTKDDQLDIMQPVLQWGNNVAFGGSYWLISNWYLWAGGAAYTTPVTSIAPGTTLEGVITYTGLTGSSYNYTCAFTGYSSTTMNVSQSNVYHNLSGGTVALPAIPLQKWAYETIESYHNTGSGFVSDVQNITDYPSAYYIRMTNINLSVNGSSPSPFSWTTGSGTASFGEYANVISNNVSGSGEVDLYFHLQPPVVNYTTPVGFTVGAAITPFNPNNTGSTATYTVSPALPAGLTMSASTGIITGTPTTTSSATNYTVTATNYAGTSSKTISIQIWPAPVLTVSYGGHSGLCVFTVTPNIPSPVTGVLYYTDLTTGQSNQTAGFPTGFSTSFTSGHTYQFYFIDYGSGSPSSAKSNTVTFLVP